MRVVIGQGDQPVAIESRWFRGDRDEVHVDLNKGETVFVAVPDPHRGVEVEPVEMVTVGIEEDGTFYVEVSSDATESTERVYERKFEKEDD